MCRHEIAHYRRIAPAGVFVWHDIASDPAALIAHQIDVDTAMQSLHVRDATGQMQTGVAAFLVIWDHIPRWRWLAGVVRWPMIHRLCVWAYPRITARRLRRRQCGI